MKDVTPEAIYKQVAATKGTPAEDGMGAWLQKLIDANTGVQKRDGNCDEHVGECGTCIKGVWVPCGGG